MFVHVLTFIFYKYYFLVTLIKSQKDPEFCKKYAPFIRNDLDNLNIVTAFPFYILFWPRVILTWGWMMIVVAISLTAMIGVKDYTKVSGWRLKIFEVFGKSCSRLNLMLAGYWWVDFDKDTTIDYSEYLGPDWKAEWDGAPTYISNHTSWLDIMYMVTHLFPGFVAKSAVKDTPLVGHLATILGSVYINRVGDSKDSKKLVFQSIIDR